MTWPFTLTRTISHRKCVRAPQGEVIRILQDRELLFSLNPLVIGVTAHPQKESTYIVKDRLVLLWGYIETHTEYTVTLHNTANGVTTEVAAGAGTSSTNEYTVEKDPETENGSVVVEKVTLKHLDQRSQFIPRQSCKQGRRAFRRRRLMIYQTVVVVYSRVLDHPVLVLSLFTAVLFIVFALRSNDPYGLFHLTLNKLPDERPSSPPKTEWLNMGYWKNTDVFPEACKALATKLIQSARLKPNGTILDVGHGTGESLIFLLSEPSVPQPATLVGITSLPAHSRRSRKRVDRLLSTGGLTTIVDLYEGDAVCAQTSTRHPLHASSPYNFDAVLALDCAYHFDTRHAFLAQSYGKLNAAGRIALADICVEKGGWKTRTITSILGLGMMPKQNMVSMEDYVEEMKGIGYVDVEMEDVSGDVFPGFTGFLKSRGWGWWGLGVAMDAYYRAGARFVIVSGSKPADSGRDRDRIDG